MIFTCDRASIAFFFFEHTHVPNADYSCETSWVTLHEEQGSVVFEVSWHLTRSAETGYI